MEKESAIGYASAVDVANETRIPFSLVRQPVGIFISAIILMPFVFGIAVILSLVLMRSDLRPFIGPLILASSLMDMLVIFACIHFDWLHASSVRISVRRIMTTLIIVALFFVARIPLLFWMGLDFFGLVHIAYLDIVLVVPALCAIILSIALRSESKITLSNAALWSAWAALIALPAVGVYATFIEPFRLQLERADVPINRVHDEGQPIKIGVLADLQFAEVSDYERGAVAKLMAEDPDIILMPGDIFHGREEDFDRQIEDIHNLFMQIKAPGGVFLVLGDVDWQNKTLDSILQGTQVRLLVNEIVHTQVGGRQITIGGLELGYRSTRAHKILRRLQEAPGDDIRVLLAHRPDAAMELMPQSQVDLVVSGHTHGGQVVMPFFGPIMTLSHVPRSVAAGGLHQLEGNYLYVSRGVGCERGQAPRIRFLCPPEISLLTLKPL